jgi:hypothetical protein
MKEIWKDIKNYESLYQVSNLGNVKNLKTNKILSSNANQYSYRYVQLRKDNRWKQYSVHRLVAITFIPNPNNHPTVNHIDRNKHNNRVDNLEWCSYSDNVKHFWKLYKEKSNS